MPRLLPATQSHPMRRTSTALLFALTAFSHAPAAAPANHSAETAARSILLRIDLHVRAPVGEPAPGRSGANPLSRYAAAVTADPIRIESTAEFARRTLAGSPTARLTPEGTAAFLRQQAAMITADAKTVAGERTPARPQHDLRVIAELGHFHARRLEAAIHYNLFLRGLRVAELVAATYAEKDAVEHWKKLVKIAESAPVETPSGPDRSLRIAADWRAELLRLEASLRDLEEQCCPPDAAVLQERVWRPKSAVELEAPVVTPVPPQLLPDAPIRLRASVAAPAGMLRVAVSVRGATGGFHSFPMEAGPDGIHSASVPLPLSNGADSLEYFFEAIGANGAGSSHPAADSASPTLRLALRR